MNLLEKIYRSRLGEVLSIGARLLSFFHRPWMIYGYRDPQTGEFYKFTRMSSTVTIISPRNLKLSDHVWVGHYSILDATEGIVIEEGCQLAAYAVILTHGSENAIRLLGREFVHIHHTERKGYTRGAVHIGAFTFVGASSIILPGVRVGKGCLIGARSLVNKDIPNYSVVVGQPAKIIGSTIDVDAKHFREHDFSATYYDPEALKMIQERLQHQ